MSEDALFQHALYVGDIKVPNEGSPANPIWIVGESPGEDEEQKLIPFTGPSGELLRDALREVGFNSEQIYFANLCNYRPYGNKFELLENSPKLAECTKQLRDDLLQHKPVLVIALGNRSMEFFTGNKGITKRRGTVEFSNISGATDIKVISTYHPSYVLRDSVGYPAFVLDLQRALRESTFRVINSVEREYHIDPSGEELLNLYYDYKSQTKLSCDIESVKRNKKGEGGDLLCIGFAKSPHHAISFNAEDPNQLKLAVDLLEDPNIEKIFHFGNGFDVPYFHTTLGVDVQNYRHDTYIAQGILNPELPKGLDFLVSVYTDEPAYKTDGRGEIPKDTKVWGKRTVKSKLYIYNCKDCAYTYEIHEKQLDELNSYSLTGLYEQVMAQTELAFHISHAGLLVDSERVDIIRRSLLYSWAAIQFLTNSMVTMVTGGALTEINVRSTPQKIKLFYELMGLPKRYKTVKKVSKLSTDEDAVVSLMTFCETQIEKLKTEQARGEWAFKKQILANILGITGYRQLLSNYVLARKSQDGRLRSIYNCGGPESGRWAAMRYIDSSGFNAQTFPRSMVKIHEYEKTGTINLAEFQKEAEKSLDDEDEEQAA
jgi:uracil-DNA glycosylase family 4